MKTFYRFCENWSRDHLIVVFAYNSSGLHFYPTSCQTLSAPNHFINQTSGRGGGGTREAAYDLRHAGFTLTLRCKTIRGRILGASGRCLVGFGWGVVVGYTPPNHAPPNQKPICARASPGTKQRLRAMRRMVRYTQYRNSFTLQVIFKLE